MSYIIKEPSNFINLKLTDTGRRLLSLGLLTFDKVILSDREIDYKFGLSDNYNICRNKILEPKDDSPEIPYNNTSNTSYNNFDGSEYITITSQSLNGAKQIVSAMTDSVGFFSGSSNNWYYRTNNTYGSAHSIGIAKINYNTNTPSGSNTVTIMSSGYTAATGDLVFIPWEPLQYSSITNNSNFIYSGRPNVSLWYRVQGVTGLTMTLDRNVPNFGSSSSTGQIINSYFYKFGEIETFYGSSTTVNCGAWNMNIVRTSSEIGTSSSMSGYTSYGSIEYNGTKKLLGLDQDYKAIGIIHYSNNYSGNTYAEQFVPTTFKMEIPHIMWHRNYTTTLGEEMSYGLCLYDYYGDTYFDNESRTSYRELRDGISTNSVVVGRVYHKLKIIVITDQELLTALTYKSNRNFTLPELNLELTPSIIGGLSGLCKTDYSYYVTYTPSSNFYNNNTSYGYPQALHCSYIKKIDGITDETTGLNSILKVSFPSFSFPYLRNENNLVALSGTGWNTNQVQILIQEIPTSASTKIGDLPTNKWILTEGGGKYTGDTGTLTINPNDLQSHVFLISQQDYDNGNIYSFEGQYSAFTQNCDFYNQSGMTFGNETFFYGNITTGIQANVYKSIFTIIAKNDEFNNSYYNSSFDDLYNDNTFITEIGILSKNSELVAVAKPSYPIKKNESRFLAFQLEMDF